MRLLSLLMLLLLKLSACQRPTGDSSPTIPIEGTWQLITGTVIEKRDTTITHYTGDVSMIKIINATHFSFLNHDLKKGADSTAVFSAGGGRYTLSGDQYTEYLDYCSFREWEGNTFPFTVSIKGDTLLQQGVEKIQDLGIERLNVEKYIRVSGR